MAIDQSKLAKCPECKTIIVTWNWFCHTDEQLGEEYVHECWICDSCFNTKHIVTNGVPYEALKVLWQLHVEGLPVVYTEAMRLLYDSSRVNKVD